MCKAPRVLHCGAERTLNGDLPEENNPRWGIGVCCRMDIGASLPPESVTYDCDCQPDTSAGALAA